MEKELSFFYDGSKYIGDWKNNYKHGKGEPTYGKMVLN